jgi:WD40 repeat protein
LNGNIQAKAYDANLIAIVKDNERFVLRFFDVIELSAAHIYESALPSSPSSSLIRAQYLDQVPNDVKFTVMGETWDACVRTIRSQSKVYGAAFSDKDDLVVVGGDNVVEIFEAATGQRRATLMTNSRVWSLAFSHDDNILASGCQDGRVDIWDLQTGGHVGTLKGHTDGIDSIEFSQYGDMVATCSDDHTIRIWNTFSLDCRCVMEGHSRLVRTVCWSASGTKVISGSEDKTIKVWSVSDKQCSPTLTIHTGGVVYSVTSSPYSSLIAAGTGDGIVKLFDAGTGHILHTISMNLGHIYSILFLNRDQIIYLKNNSGMLGIWDLTKNADVLTFKYEGWGCAMSSNGTRIVSSQSNVVKIWQTDTPIQNQDMAQNTPIQNLEHHRTKPVKNMLKKIKSVFIPPYRKIRPEVPQEIQDASGHTGLVRCITFSEDGQLMASASEDQTAKIWDTSTGQCLTTFCGHMGDHVYRVILSRDSTLCASWGGDNDIHIWEVRTGNPVSTIRHWDSVKHYVMPRMRFSPDGSQLVSLSFSHLDMVKLWDVATGQPLASMEASFDPKSTEISFGVDGSSIILRGDSDDNIRRWTLSSAHNLNHTDNSTTIRLPMVFVPVQDTEPHIFPDVSQNHYHCDRKSSWVLDRQNRRMLWIPPDSKAFCDEERVVLVSGSVMQIIVDFSNVTRRF